MTPRALRDLAREQGMPAYRGRQIAEWLYHKHVDSIDEMTSLSKADRARLSEEFHVGRGEPVARRVSRDGTVKYAFAVARHSENAGPHRVAEDAPEPGRIIETTLIPDGERRTLCLSTQVGCARGCAICATGRMGFHGNLTPGEILNQAESIPERDEITNIVYMGMGEPLDNIDAVLESLEVFTEERGYGMSPRRITVSTIGIAEPLRRLLEESEAHIAISLHSPFPEERAELIPAERNNPAADTLEVLRSKRWDGQRRLSFEYALIDGRNDTAAHAKAIARLIEGLEARVNLIPVNSAAGLGFEPPAAERVEAFQKRLLAAGLRTTVRKSRGADIEAACGLLAGRVAG
jgi:23S rRNA (adenine2503-C2)-methyltransferase